MKVNVDEGWDSHSSRACIAILPKIMMGNQSGLLGRALEIVLVRKRLTCFEGLRQMENRCHGSGILESDCANVIGALQANMESRYSLCNFRLDFELRNINQWSNKVCIVYHTLCKVSVVS
jgi:hypothetical protein